MIKKTAHQRVQLASNGIEKAKRLNATDERAIARAQAKGRDEKVPALLIAIAKRSQRIRALDRVVAKYRPIMQISDYAARLEARPKPIVEVPVKLKRKPKDAAARSVLPGVTDIPAEIADKREIATKTVPDPISGRPLVVAINIHESPIECMFSRKRIDAAEYGAAERFRSLYERAGIGGLRAIDPRKEAVDGQGEMVDLNVSAMEAQADLRDAHDRLGSVLYGYIVTVVGEMIPLSEMAKHYGRLSGKRAEGFVAGQVIAGLGLLVSLWGMRARRNNDPHIRSSRTPSTGPAKEWEVNGRGELQEVENALVSTGTK